MKHCICLCANLSCHLLMLGFTAQRPQELPPAFPSSCTRYTRARDCSPTDWGFPFPLGAREGPSLPLPSCRGAKQRKSGVGQPRLCRWRPCSPARLPLPGGSSAPSGTPWTQRPEPLLANSSSVPAPPAKHTNRVLPAQRPHPPSVRLLRAVRRPWAFPAAAPSQAVGWGASGCFLWPSFSSRASSHQEHGGQHTAGA